MSMPRIGTGDIATGRPLETVKLTRFEWSVVVAVLTVARDGLHEAQWLFELRPQMELLTQEIEEQAGLADPVEALDAEPSDD